MRPFLCIFMLVMTLIVTGCWDRREINDLAFISGAAGDLSEEGEFIVSFQVAIPSPSGQSGGSSQQDKFFVISASGKNATEILQKLQKKSSRMLFTSHRSVIFIGERLARRGIDDVLDVFTHDPRNRLRTYTMVVRGGEGRELLQTRYPFEQVPVEAIKEMESLGSETAVTLRDFFIASSSEGLSPVMGVIECEKLADGMNQNKYNKFTLSGSAILKDFKLVGYLDSKETEGLLWVKNKMKFCRITASLPDGQGDVGVLVTHSKGTIIPYVNGESIKVKISLQGQGSLIENNSSLDIRMREHHQLVQKTLEKAVERQVKESITKVQKQYKTDSFGFGQEIYREKPKEWKTLKDQWDSKFPDVEVDVEVKLTISDSGMAGPRLLLKKEEIIE